MGTDSAYKVTNTYDELTRLSNKQYAVVGNQNTTLKTSYSYIDWSGENSNRTTGIVRGIDYTFVKNTDDLSTHDRWYTYDNAGNILTESIWLTNESPRL